MDVYTYWLVLYPLSIVLAYIMLRWGHRYERIPFPVLLMALVPLLQWGIAIMFFLMCMYYIANSEEGQEIADKILGGKGARNRRR